MKSNEDIGLTLMEFWIEWLMLPLYTLSFRRNWNKGIRLLCMIFSFFVTFLPGAIIGMPILLIAVGIDLWEIL